MSADEMLKKLATLPLAYQPGSSFEYSIATDLLGHIIERVTGKPLDVVLKEMELDPLKMQDTTFYVQRPALQRLARPLASDPDMRLRLARRDQAAQAFLWRGGYGVNRERLLPPAATDAQRRRA